MNKRIRNKKMFPKVGNFRKCLLKVGDEVIVIAGGDRGKKGKIIDFDRKRGKIKVDGVRIQTHFQKRTQEQAGEIIKKEGFMDISNVMFVENDVPTRLARSVDGKRISVKTKKEI